MARFTTAFSAIALSFFFSTATLADDGSTSSQAAGSVNTASGGHGTQATDRGGRPAPTGDLDISQGSLLDWLRALMD